jgi:hypothetical protein
MLPSQTRTRRSMGFGVRRDIKGWFFSSAHEARLGAAALMAIASSLVHGCSLMLDTEEPQCKVTDDCLIAFGTSPYVCQNEFCVRPSCETTADCRNMGPQFATAICDANKLCATAECVGNEQCGVGAVCDPAKNVCIPKQCDTTEECKSRPAYNSPLVTCQAGICVDEKWGCINDADNRPPTTMPTATMKVRLVEFQTMNPHMSVDARVCNTPTFGDSCEQTLPGTASSYDPTTGWVSITGVPLNYGWRYALQAGPNPTSSDPRKQPRPIDFYSQKTPQDIFEAPTSLTTVTRELLDVLAMAFPIDVEIPEDSAGATLFVFDCQDRPADGVVMAPLNETSRVYYFGQTGTPDPAAVQTSSSGMMSILNMPFGDTVTLKPAVRVGTTDFPLPEFQVLALPSRVTTIHLYPRDYVK